MKWVTMWGNAQSLVLPHPAYYAKNVTLRYPIFIPFTGKKIRITLDNFCCSEEVAIEQISVGIGNKFSDELLISPLVLTYKHKESFVIPAHGSIITDELLVELVPEEYLVVSIYLKGYTNLTSGVDITGPLSKGYFAYGNQALKNKLDINTSKSTTWVYFLSNIDIYTDDDNEAIICYGDSITSQDWPDYFLLALREKGYKNYAVVRKAVSGTRILREYSCITYQSYGKSGYHRFLHEISSVQGAKNIILQHGINDIIHPVGAEVNPFRPMSDLPTLEELIRGLTYYKEEAKRLGLDPIFGTLLPIYGWRTYEMFREELKNGLNDWIRKENCIDFEKKIGICIDGSYHFIEGCDSGDHLHPSKFAYEKMGRLAADYILQKNSKCKK
ncbi:MAG: hypothetical protein K2N64_07480 [Anaeroplasmataceae bacterium]|nr:hypothetical protein [Anaeroplasmataceae bacterium]